MFIKTNKIISKWCKVWIVILILFFCSVLMTIGELKVITWKWIVFFFSLGKPNKIFNLLASRKKKSPVPALKSSSQKNLMLMRVGSVCSWLQPWMLHSNDLLVTVATEQTSCVVSCKTFATIAKSSGGWGDCLCHASIFQLLHYKILLVQDWNQLFL